MTERDLRDWRGIGTGYLLMFIYAALFASILLAPPGLDRWEQRSLFALALMALYGVCALARHPARRLVEEWAGGERGRHEGLKNVAVAALCILSIGLCVGAFPLAWRYSW